MQIIRATVAVSLAAVAASIVVTSAQRAPMTAFEGARVLVGDGRVIERATLLVDNGRIVSVGPAAQARVPANAVRVDLSGKTVMPTLIDAHIHVGYENLSSWSASNYTRENVINTLDRLAYFGVGAVLSTGSDPLDIAESIVTDQAAGRIGGARFLYAAGFGPPGQGPNAQLLAELAKFPTPVVRGITGDADARQGVRDVAAKHVRFVKVWVTDRNGTQTKTTPAAYRALVDEAHKQNIRALAHATDSLADAKDLARSGLDGSLHAVPDADAEFAALMKRNNAFLAPTQGFGLRGAVPGADPWFEDPLFVQGTPAATLERYRRQAAAQKPAPNAATLDDRLARVAPMIKVLLAGGVRIVVGTDAGAGPDYPPGYPVHREMELYTKMGMTPEQVITAATKAGAEALQIDRDLGTLEPGKLANLLVLDADPRVDIRNTRRIERVYLAGQAVNRAALRPTQGSPLVPAGTLRAAFLASNPVQGRVDPQTGAVTGPVGDLLPELGKRLGVPFRFMPVADAASVIAAVQNGNADIGFLAYEAERASKVDFSAPYALMGNAYLVLATSPAQRSADLDRDGATVGAVAGQSQQIWASEHLRRARVRMLPTVPPHPDLVAMLVRGDVQAFAANRQRMEDTARTDPRVRVLADNFSVIPQALVVRQGNARLLDELNRFVADVLASGLVRTSLQRAKLAGVEPAS